MKMTNKHKIYLIILKQKCISLRELETAINIEKMQLLKAVSHLVIKRKIKAKTNDDGVRYFSIIDKPL
jgi:predicted transcriptional regulator